MTKEESSKMKEEKLREKEVMRRRRGYIPPQPMVTIPPPTTAESRCPYCGVKVPPDAVFCVGCGKPISLQQRPQIVQQPQQSIPPLQQYTPQLQKLSVQEEPVSKEKLEQLKAVLSMSEKIQVQDVVEILGVSRAKALVLLTEIKKSIPSLKLSGDIVNLEQGDVNQFINALDQQFSSWESKEKGKIEKRE